jgi:2-dehydro-3-deoxyphosphogluconate aldolase/(4S)-4-hydroxy-2-oxoglutarate aldolase
MTRKEVCTHITDTGIIPAIRVSSAEDARFAITALAAGGLSLIELTMTTPGALALLSELTRPPHSARLILGAGSIRDAETARRCLDAGAAFLTSPGLIPAVIDFALKQGVAIIPGALTPTEVLTAMQAGAVDFIKIFPCAQVGGPSYIKALKAPFSDARLIASGGVNQKTAADFIHAGAAALGIRQELIPPEAIENRNEDWIHELSQRFRRIVKQARREVASGAAPVLSVE